MINILKSGTYKLIETKRHTKILYLGPVAYAWIEPEHIGVILVTTHNIHKTDCVLSIGHFRIYDVEQEPQLSDNQHLELEVGKNSWQGYLLLTGLPDDRKTKSRIIPTHEIITSNSRFMRPRTVRRAHALTRM